MRKEIADFVFPVMRAAIEYKEGLRANENVWKFRFAECQKKMLALLLAPVPDVLRLDVLGDAIGAGAAGAQLGFLGIRYALACWLDDIFILDSVWKDQWNASKMEFALFKLNKRNTEFWEQAQRSQARPTRDALETYYLCVMLGFRGKMYDKPAELNSWRDLVQAQITQGEDREFSPPQGLQVPPTVDRPLRGVRQAHKWLKIRTFATVVFVAIVAAMAVIWLVPK